MKTATHDIYKKTVFYYSFLIMSMVLILEGNFLITIKRQKIDAIYNQQVRIVREIEEEMESISSYTKNCMYELYETESALNDMIAYVNLDSKHYIKNKLDNYVESKQYIYESRERFIQNAFTGRKDLEAIHIISYKNEKVTKYEREDVIQIENYDKASFLEEEEGHEVENEFFIEKRFLLDNQNKPIGEIHFFYNNSRIKKAMKERDSNIGILVEKDGGIFFQSQLQEENVSFDNKKYQIIRGASAGFNVICYVQKKQAKKLSYSLRTLMIGLGIGFIVIGELFVHLYMKRLSNRLNSIVHAMEEIKKGNLSVRLPIKKQEDELDVIGVNLNVMCQELKTYIDKSYLAELGQRKAEMEAMQNQINPHFLYNTLEAIRMKAMINQDKEVGKMLYGLAIIFRSQIKENPIIPIAKELYLCKQYLELYKFRHPNRFSFDVICPDELMEYSILKFSIQPIIENYFVHGIRATDMDNYILVEVKEEEENPQNILIEIIDNGSGMSKEELEKKNEELSLKEQNQEYIGLSNIQMRLKIEFGEEYGIYLSKGIENGVKVMMKIPKRVEK